MYYKPLIEFSPEEVLEYLRKSRSDDMMMTVAEVLAKHEAMLDEWAEKNLGARVPDRNKFREIVSGETLKERPEIQEVLRKIESPRYKAILIVEPQRLTRGDLEDIGRIMKLLKHTDTKVITLTRIYDLRDEYDWDAFERELKRGNEFLEYTKKILNRGRLLSVAQGNYIGNVPPYGYDKDWVMDGRRKCPTLKINEEQATIVRMIFDMYVNKDMGAHLICKALDDTGAKPPRGEHWSPPAVLDMLENVHYIGKVRWNFRKTITIVEDGELIKSRPNNIEEVLIYEGKHPAIISEELFNAVKAKKGRYHRTKPNAKIRNPLAGILYCRCGRAMSLRTYKSHRGAPRLLCDGQTHCKSGSVLYEEMMQRVRAILVECIEDFEIRLTNDTGDSVKLHKAMIKNMEKKLAELSAKELAQWDAQTNPDESQRMPPHIFKQLNDQLLKEKEALNKALCKAYESMPEPEDYEEKLTRFRDALDALDDPEVDAQKKNRLLKACIDKIIYHRDQPERIKSKQVRYYDKKLKKTRWKSPLPTGGNWTTPPIELDVKLKV